MVRLLTRSAAVISLELSMRMSRGPFLMNENPRGALSS